MSIRNIAIIAHVDHGKTTLVDRILQQVKMFREGQEVEDLIMDSNDLEKERGITILSKHVSVRHKGVKVNFIDTPGHQDFGGEVERVLNMADGVLLLVDALEGPMPQTRFVLQKALGMGLKPLVVVNKVDKPNCDPEATNEKVFDLMYDLSATEEQLDFATVYGSSKEGWMGPDPETPTKDVAHLLDSIVEGFEPPVERDGPLQLRISSLDHSSFTGRLAIGRVHRGSIRAGDRVAVVDSDGVKQEARVKELYTFEGLEKKKSNEAVGCGEIVAIMGLGDFEIGDTVADAETPTPLTPLSIDEPAVSVIFTINDSPFHGQEGKYVTSRQLRERLFNETERNLALSVEETDSPEKLLVYGRGILHLSILVETMRREGYEFQLGQPQVVTKRIDGQDHEPVEALYIDVPEDVSGKVIELVTQRKGELLRVEKKGDRVDLSFRIPARGAIGLTNPVMTVSAGEAVLEQNFEGFEPWKGPIMEERNGALIAMEEGTVVAYSLDQLQDRGRFFIEPNDEVYAGQVVGENSRKDDLTVNVTKQKKLTNMRSSGADKKVSIAPPLKLSLEGSLEYVGEDEYIEVTPHHIRLRKILLKEKDRKRQRPKVGS